MYKVSVYSLTLGLSDVHTYAWPDDDVFYFIAVETICF